MKSLYILESGKYLPIEYEKQKLVLRLCIVMVESTSQNQMLVLDDRNVCYLKLMLMI